MSIIIYPNSISELEGSWTKVGTYPTVRDIESIYPKLKGRGPFAVAPMRKSRGRCLLDVYERVDGEDD